MSHSSAVASPPVLVEILNQAGVSGTGAPVFLTFFRSDCPWCASELPRLAEAFRRYPSLTFHVIGISGGTDDAATAQEFADQKNWPHPVLTDADGTIRTAFNIERVPTVVLINQKGKLERTYQGVTEQLVGILEQTVMSAVHGTEPPNYTMVGNGCAP